MYNLLMERNPPPLLMTTFMVAVMLKFSGGLVGMGLTFWLLGEWVNERWWMVLVTAVILLLLLLPWPKQNRNHWLIAALAWGILSPHLDLIVAAWISPAKLLANARFLQIGWSFQVVNNIFALGQLFIAVPVVLASWHYGRRGFFLSLGFAGFLYTITPFLLPDRALLWGFYAVRGFVLLGVVLILAYTTETLASAQRRSNQALVAANRQLAVQATMMEQLAVSRERNRLARELHDTLAHSLSGTAVSLQAINTLLKHNPVAAQTELQQAQSQIRDGLTEARRAITALRASPLEALGLAEAVRQRATTVSERAGVPIQCHINSLPLLPVDVEQAVYRIADEALLNTEKHAQATKIELHLQHHNGLLTLKVRDDGVGFLLESVLGNGRFGLMGLQERADLIQAQLDIQTAPGNGTTLTLQVKTE
jgi:signal transduction histidine kinase